MKKIIAILKEPLDEGRTYSGAVGPYIKGSFGPMVKKKKIKRIKRY